MPGDRVDALLMSRTELESRRGEAPAWAVNLYAKVARSLESTDVPFPCLFGVQAFRSDSLRFTLVDDGRNASALLRLADALAEFTRMARGLGRYTSLLALFRPRGALSLESYRRHFWNVLQFLHDHDPEPWPSDIPVDPDNPFWEFSFNGNPMFVVCNTPEHRVRRSRNGPGLMITFQPRWVFEGLEETSALGRQSRRTIRARLLRYDGLPAHPDLGTYGNPAHREWKQYFLPDDQDTELRYCPLSIGPVAARPEEEEQRNADRP